MTPQNNTKRLKEETTMFKNLKIKINLQSELIADRFLTFDSIILHAHYNNLRSAGELEKSKFIEIVDDIDNLSKWIEVKKEQVSGSVWYAEDETIMLLHNVPIRKTTSPQAMYDATGKKITSNSKRTPSSGEFKRFDLAFETMQLDSIYFYVRGNKEYITKLCSYIKYVGKKASAGFGWVKNIEIEEIAHDKSFMLDEFTPSKPLSVSNNNINSKKIAYYRTLPPYSDKKGQVPCYMPTMSLLEKSDNTRNNPNFKVYNIEHYISNTQFLQEKLSDKTKFDFLKLPIKKGFVKISPHMESDSLLDTPMTVICTCCGTETNEAVVGNVKNLFGANFNDFPFIDKGNAVCSSCLWSFPAESCKLIDFSFINPKKVTYLYGKNMEIFSDKKSENDKIQSEYRKDFIKNLDMLTPPFSVNFNTNAGKSNHIAFKGKVTLSNAMVVFNYGDTGAEFIDVELLNEAIKDMVTLTEQTQIKFKKGTGFKKTHFLNLEDYKGDFSMAKELNTLENRTILSNFHKKYNASTRRALHKIKGELS